jgi:two-component system cell cycle response regulator
VERRGWLVIVAAGLGVLLGVVGAATDAGTLAVVAAAAALVAGVAAARLVTMLRAARVRIDELDDKVEALEDDLAREAKAREEAEQTLSSRLQLTAMRQATQGDSLTDAITGLYSEGWFTVVLDATITEARRTLTPVAVVLLDVVAGLQDGTPHPAEPRRVANAITSTIRDTDTACRLMDGSFALVLEDTDDNGAIWTVERVRRHLAAGSPGLTLWAGVACYPAHGFEVEELLDRADHALDAAREWRQDRIEVAAPGSD